MNAVLIRCIAGLVLGHAVTARTLSAVATAQAVASGLATRQIVFKSVAHRFQLVYPSSFGVCGQDATTVCDPSLGTWCGEDALVCVMLPEAIYQGSNFYGGGLAIRLIKGNDGVTPCGSRLQAGNGSDEVRMPALQPKRIIHGVPFTYAETSDVATGTVTSVETYRAAHLHRCYEVAIQISGSNYANFEPETAREFTGAEEKQVRAMLNAILSSFRFTRP